MASFITNIQQLHNNDDGNTHLDNVEPIVQQFPQEQRTGDVTNCKPVTTSEVTDDCRQQGTSLCKRGCLDLEETASRVVDSGLDNSTSVVDGSNVQSQSQTCFAASHPSVVDNIYDGVQSFQSNKKKQKVGLDLDNKTVSKRPNRTYRAKIDIKKSLTPKTKTPKLKTPKVVIIPKSDMKSVEKDSNVNIPANVPLEQAEFPIESSCRHSLNFEIVPDLGIDAIAPAPDNVQQVVVEKVEPEEILINVPEQCENPVTAIVVDIETKGTIKPERTMLVYRRRRINCMCLNESRKLGPNFVQRLKKKTYRRKASFEALKKFSGFNYTSILEDLLQRILSVKGKSQDLSLLCSYGIKTKKKRSKRLAVKTKYPLLNEQSVVVPHSSSPLLIENERTALVPHSSPPMPQPSPSTTCALVSEAYNESSLAKGDEHNVVKILDAESVGLCPQTPSPSLETKTNQKQKQKNEKKLKNTSKDSNKTKTKKEKKTTRPYNKRKEKQDDYLNLSVFDHASVDRVMDRFAQKLASLSLREDPKQWSIIVRFPDNQGDKIEFETTNLKEETTALFKRIQKFVNVMSFYQGSKQFVKWNGSVLDSVVGVFLTQNVSDVLSSDAYLRVAAHFPIARQCNKDNEATEEEAYVNGSQGSFCSSQGSSDSVVPNFIVEYPVEDEEIAADPTSEETKEDDGKEEYDAALREMLAAMPNLQDKGKGKQDEGPKIDWEAIRKNFSKDCVRTPETQDSVNWEAVRASPVHLIARLINCRGQQNIIAAKIQRTLNRILEDHHSLDLEWLRGAPPEVAKAYLLSFYGLGLKSVDCLRLLTLHHHGFPVDVNIGRIAIRLGWVPIKPLPAEMPFYLLQKYPLEGDIQRYLWPRLCHLRQEELYHLHYQMITFGKLFCLKRSPNCQACPLKADCKYYASLPKSKQALPWKPDGRSKKSKSKDRGIQALPNPFDHVHRRIGVGSLPYQPSTHTSPSCSSKPCCSSSPNGSFMQLLFSSYHDILTQPEYIVEEPSSPEPQVEQALALPDIEDFGYHLVNLSTKKDHEQSPAPSIFSHEDNGSRIPSKELVCVSSSTTSDAVPMHRRATRLRTDHQVYIVPRNSPLLKHCLLDAQCGDEPYLLAIWMGGEVQKTNASEVQHSCLDGEASSSHEDTPTVPGTILIPVRTALHNYFPLNGTYFQPNEVFADEETSKCPVNVPTSWIWGLEQRTLYCGSSASAIVRGSKQDDIQKITRLGFICVRGFDRKTRAPLPLPNKFHDRSSKKAKSQAKDNDNEAKDDEAS